MTGNSPNFMETINTQIEETKKKKSVTVNTKKTNLMHHRQIAQTQ